jgi:hypothetical protein
MTAFRDRYLSERVNEPLRILDVGSQDVNGSYRQIFSEPRWSYTGLDMTAGPQCRHRRAHAVRMDRVASGSADVVVSGQAFEHIQYFWITMLGDRTRALDRKAYCLASSRRRAGPRHRVPALICWRYLSPTAVGPRVAQFTQM